MLYDYTKIQITSDYLESVIKNNNYNKTIIDYYKKYRDDVGFYKNITNKIQRMNECNQFYFFDTFYDQNIKDFQKTSLCGDKFCNNCKKVKQAVRMRKFKPFIEKYQDKLNFYQMVLTVPNIPGTQIHDTIKNLFKSFYEIMRYLTGKSKIKGIDFQRWGYEGAIRSLEVTYKGKDYHPHLHVLVAMRGYLGPKEHINKYSKDWINGRKQRKFSDEEILIQKIWYLLINKEKVTKSNIDNLLEGYSCMMDQFQEGDYLELFKYMTKNDKGKMTYIQFKDLYQGLLNVRQIQGYGVFFRITDDFDLLKEAAEEIYKEMRAGWEKVELPYYTIDLPKELLTQARFTLISRKKIAATLLEKGFMKISQ